MLRAEFLKLARRGLLWWLAAAAVGLTLLRGLAFPPDPATPWPGLWSAGLVTVVLAILAAITVGQEFDEGTFRALAARGIARWRPIVAPWLALVLVSAVLLVGLEGLAVVLGVRQALPWGDVLRAWLATWPVVSLVLLLAVVARNGGLPLIVSVLLLAAEQFAGILLGGMAALGEIDSWWQDRDSARAAGQSVPGQPDL
jgi:ABC-type transport system involved in multi-copper enzyme maturation permease subunit